VGRGGGRTQGRDGSAEKVRETNSIWLRINNLVPDSGNLSENLAVAQLLMKWPFLYRTGMFTAVFTTDLWSHLYLDLPSDRLP
jgi:hypothetical protein